MTNEKILQLLYQIDLTDKQEKDPAVIAMTELREGVKQNIMDENNKQNNNAKTAKVVKAILKNAMKKHPENKVIQGTWIRDEKMYVCDGYRILCLNKPTEAQKIPDDCEPLKVEHLLKNDGIEIEIPSLSDINGNIKICKARKTRNQKCDICMSIGNEKNIIHVNAIYLAEMIEGLGEDCKIFINKERPEINPIYFESEIGSGALLPVKKEDENRRLGEYWIK